MRSLARRLANFLAQHDLTGALPGSWMAHDPLERPGSGMVSCGYAGLGGVEQTSIVIAWLFAEKYKTELINLSENLGMSVPNYLNLLVLKKC